MTDARSWKEISTLPLLEMMTGCPVDTRRFCINDNSQNNPSCEQFHCYESYCSMRGEISSPTCPSHPSHTRRPITHLTPRRLVIILERRSTPIRLNLTPHSHVAHVIGLFVTYGSHHAISFSITCGPTTSRL